MPEGGGGLAWGRGVSLGMSELHGPRGSSAYPAPFLSPIVQMGKQPESRTATGPSVLTGLRCPVGSGSSPDWAALASSPASDVSLAAQGPRAQMTAAAPSFHTGSRPPALLYTDLYIKVTFLAPSQPSGDWRRVRGVACEDAGRNGIDSAS